MDSPEEGNVSHLLSLQTHAPQPPGELPTEGQSFKAVQHGRHVDQLIAPRTAHKYIIMTSILP